MTESPLNLNGKAFALGPESSASERYRCTIRRVVLHGPYRFQVFQDGTESSEFSTINRVQVEVSLDRPTVIGCDETTDRVLVDAWDDFFQAVALGTAKTSPANVAVPFSWTEEFTWKTPLRFAWRWQAQTI